MIVKMRQMRHGILKNRCNPVFFFSLFHLFDIIFVERCDIMKKSFVIFFSMVLLFLFSHDVSAAEQLATCSYKATMAGDQISFDITIDRDGELTYSLPPKEYYTGPSGRDYFIQYKNFNGYSMALFDGSQLASSCPKLAVGRDNQNVLWVYHGRDSSSLEEAGMTDCAMLSGTMKKLSNNVSVDTRKEKEYCTLSKDLATNTPINIRFYESVDGVKMFEASSYANSSIQSRAVDYRGVTSLTVGSSVYTISLDPNWENIAAYYSDNCKSAKIYLNAVNGNPHVFYVTTKKPDDANNASDFKGNDNGESYDKNSGGENNEKTEHLTSDLDIPKYCNEGNVAQTLKFIGILLFIAKIFVPALIIILGSVDFAQAMMAGKDDEVKKKIPILIKRFAAGIIIFFIPSIIDFLFSVLDGYSDSVSKYSNCRTCILNPGDCKVSK